MSEEEIQAKVTNSNSQIPSESQRPLWPESMGDLEMLLNCNNLKQWYPKK